MFPWTIIGSLLACFTLPAATFFDVRDYGAKGDGLAKDTRAIQSAIDAAARQGGGIVVLPAGTYLTGTVRLKDNLTIQLSPGATPSASPDRNDFDPYEKLPYESHADNETTYFHYALLAGEDVTIRDVTIKNAPNYAISFPGCDWVNVDGVNILNGYADGDSRVDSREDRPDTDRS